MKTLKLKLEKRLKFYCSVGHPIEIQEIHELKEYGILHIDMAACERCMRAERRVAIQEYKAKGGARR